VYDTRVAAILGRSLARTASVTSFRTSLQDSFATTGVHTGSTMTQMNTGIISPRRPMGMRSLSSPTVHGEEESSSGEDEYEDDEEDALANAESSFRLESLLRGAATHVANRSMKVRLKGNRSSEAVKTVDRKVSPRTVPPKSPKAAHGKSKHRSPTGPFQFPSST